MIIQNALIYCSDHAFHLGWLQTDGTRIAAVHTESAAPDSASDVLCLDAKGGYLIPGLIDIHLHGCLGMDFSDGSKEATETIAEYLLSNGITGFTPATMSLSRQELERIFQTASSYPNKCGAKLLGIHMEGPYFSEKKKGAQAADYLRLPSVEEFYHFQTLSGNHITQIDVAPELENAIPFIQEVSKTVTVSLGHSAADYQTAFSGFQAGASHVTHLFNGMMPFAHRDPAIPGAAFDSPNVTVELIGDGIHLHPSMIRSMFQLFGEERIQLISDSMRATGMPDGIYTLGGQEVHVLAGKATLSDGTIAGSSVHLLECLRRVVSFGIPLESAIRCTSENQAKELGLFSELGSLETGKYANLVLLQQDLSLQAVILEGVQKQDLYTT